MLLTKPGSTIVTPIAKATIYGERYAVVHYPDADKPYVHKMDGIGFAAPTAMKDTPVFHYFSVVANARQDRATSKTDREIAANVVRQLEKLPASADTALQAYSTGRNGTLAPGQGLIYPFGLNESQLAAVEQAFRAQVSVIEGPPGTGKTQTILNILANILLRGQTVAVLSNNNAAVENVYEAGEMRPGPPDCQARQPGQPQGLLHRPAALAIERARARSDAGRDSGPAGPREAALARS